MNATGTPATLLDRERSALDLPVAGLAALAVAFAAFTVPDALLGRAVEATGLPLLLTAAQPPLGSTARMLMAVAGALVAFAAAFALLRWLDRFAARVPSPVSAAPAGEADERTHMPRVHRADAHPDAPPRRPISAARDLGEPAPPSRPAQARVAMDVEPWAAEPPVPKTEPSPAEPVAVAEPVSAPAPSMPSPAAPVRAAVPPPSVPKSASLGDLMARLERGLAQREQCEREAAPAPMPAPIMTTAAAAGPGSSASAASPARKAQERDRLQSAIDGLRALSAGV
jgi:hypothetical protein